MVNPKLRDYGIAAVLFSLLSALILFIFSMGDRGPVLFVFSTLSAAAGIAGVLMIVIAKREDPDFIHSFALCGSDELHHILTWIPGREADFKSFPDNFTPAKLLEKRKHNYSDVADFVCSDEFVDHVCAVLDGKASEHPLQQYVIVHPMNRPAFFRDKLGYRIISYFSGEGKRPSYARLDRHNDGYDRITALIMSHTEV